MANWDWEDFAEGIATSIGPGITTGINLRKAGQAEEAERLKTIRENPSLGRAAEAEYGRRGFDAVPTPDTEFGMFRDQPTFATPSTFDIDVGLPEVDVAAPPRIDLMSAKEAQDRQRATRMTAFSPEVEKMLKSLSDREVKMLREERQGRESERVAADLKTNAAKYYDVNVKLRKITAELDRLDTILDTETDPDRRQVTRDKMKTLSNTARSLDADGSTAREALLNLGVSEDDFPMLERPGEYGPNVQRLIEKYTGATKTRAPGARSR